MRMTVTLDEKLLEEARMISKKKTKREVIEEALREFVRRKRREDALKYAGTIDMDIDLEDLIKMREQE